MIHHEAMQRDEMWRLQGCLRNNCRNDPEICEASYAMGLHGSNFEVREPQILLIATGKPPDHSKGFETPQLGL